MAKKIVNVENKTVEFEFGEGVDGVTFDLSSVSPEIVTKLALHGASQKIGDSYASAKKATEGTEIDPSVWASQQAASVVGQLIEGDWTVRTPGSGGGVTDLATALAEATGQPVEDAITVLSDKDKDEKAALRKHPAIAAILARIKRERAEAKEKVAAAKADDGPDLADFIA